MFFLHVFVSCSANLFRLSDKQTPFIFALSFFETYWTSINPSPGQSCLSRTLFFSLPYPHFWRESLLSVLEVNSPGAERGIQQVGPGRMTGLVCSKGQRGREEWGVRRSEEEWWWWWWSPLAAELVNLIIYRPNERVKIKLVLVSSLTDNRGKTLKQPLLLLTEQLAPAPWQYSLRNSATSHFGCGTTLHAVECIFYKLLHPNRSSTSSFFVWKVLKSPRISRVGV